MKAKEKAAWVLDTPKAAFKSSGIASLTVNDLACKAYSTLRAEFALLGVTLRRCHRAADGRITYEVTRNQHSRVFSHLHDLHAHLAALEAARRAATKVKQKPVAFESQFDDDEFN